MAAILWLTVGASTVGGTSTTAGDQPRLACEQRSYDFGQIPNIETVSHTFCLRNSGAGVLTIQRVRVCCGATADLSAQVIPAGGTVDARVRLSLAGRTGPQKKSIYVISDDPAEPYFQLQLVGTATAEIDVVPSRLDFGDVDERATAEQTARLAARPGLMFHVTNVTSTVAWLDASCKPDGSGHGYTLTVHTVPPLPSGAAAGRVVLLTDLAAYPRIEVPASVRVDSDVVVAPREIVLRRQGDPSSDATRYIALRRRGGKPFRILEVEAPYKDIRVQTAPLGNFGYRFAIDNLPKPAALEGRFLTIHTDIEGMEEIDVPFRFERGDSE